jgi:ubiquinone/menaquinone biosynthesis C-methylase UbiE
MLVALRAPLRLPLAAIPEEDLSFLERRFTPRTVYMEVGAASCAFALRAASHVERVYAIDVSGYFLHTVPAPLNLKLVLCDGVRIPVPEASVDLAWGGAFIDHLHPDDAAAHLRSVHRTLAAKGEYLFTTQQPAGAVRQRLLAAGFSTVRISLFSRLRKPLRITAIR